MVVRAEGVEPTQPCGQRIFLPLRLSPPSPKSALGRFVEVRGLDYPFTLPRKIRGLGAARLVSTPSRSIASGLARDCH
jgi:hypothetical protein